MAKSVLAERFWEKATPDPNSGCWLWTGGLLKDGYAGFAYREGKRIIHKVGSRFAYELTYGQIPFGLQIDHLCKVKSCINPNHLEAVTAKENSHRARGSITYCPKGHPYSGKNLYVGPHGGRRCKTCHREDEKRRREKRRSHYDEVA